jgi:uncharacterized protein YndB with AHSA1/START domain
MQPLRIHDTSTLNVTHHYQFPAQRVFDAWLDPLTVGQWLFATPTGMMKTVEIDARVGGNFLLTEERDGKDVEHHGEYLAIDRPRYLVFSFGGRDFPATQVRVKILEAGDGCDLTLIHDGVWPDYEEKTRAGWMMILGNLEKTLQQGGH